jgi:hypothetical protein
MQECRQRVLFVDAKYQLVTSANGEVRVDKADFTAVCE